ncbi:hypothetical protein K438DRAFT_1980355 [Mycena galopus ATCC 62051]|nr:hypothetical protein K438DRAFT_1980355 [Mycena galopus ATCC 62051]
MPVNTRSSSVARTPSPVGSDSSDIYYDDPVFVDASSPTAMPAATAILATTTPDTAADDAYDPDGYDTNADAAASMNDRNTTPTPQPVRNTSPASVIEITEDDFPALTTPVPAAAAATRRKAGKKNKGKKHVIQENADEGDPFLAAATATAIADPLGPASDMRFEADTATAVANSLGLTNTAHYATAGTSSSRRVLGSPLKCQCTNSAGDAAPAPTRGSTQASGSPFLVPTSSANNAAAAPTDAAAAPIAAVLTPTVNVPAAAPAPPVTVPVVAAPHVHTVAPVTFAAALAAPAPAALPNLAPAPAVVVQNIIAANPIVAPAGPTWPTADGNPPRGSYTAIPAGFPPIVYSHTLLTQGIPPNLMQMYQEVPGPNLIHNSISNAIDIEPTNFQLGTPPTADNGTTSSLWLVAGIPEHLAATVLTYPFLSSGRITIYPLPFNLPVNGFVGTFTDFTLPNNLKGAAVARNLIQTAIRGDNNITQLIQTHRDTLSPHVSAERASEIFIDSVQVDSIELVVGNTTTIAWQLYVTPPTNDHNIWLNLRRLFGRLHVMTALHGSARMQRAYRCRICPGINHPTGLCPRRQRS